jgi:hypothetical protein
MDSDELDPESSLALAVVDEGSSPSAGEFMRLGEQFESLRSIIQAFDAVDTGEVTPATPPPAAHWGPFVLREEIGRGTFGIVCRAFDPATDRDIAIKLYRRSELPEEPRLLGQVRHPNVVMVFGAAIHDGKPGIWMELVRGRTLAERVQADGPVTPVEAIRIGRDLCGALGAVHAAGLVHQDIKPRNVMQETDGRIVLMDFGSGLSRDDADDPTVLRFSGTPLYMAPEVVRGARPSACTDVYSVGVLLFYILTGTYPVYATNLQELRRLHERELDRSVRRFAALMRELRPEAPPALAEVVARALVPEADRYASPIEFASALEAVGTAKTEVGRLRAWTRGLAAAALMAVTLGLFGVRAFRQPPTPPATVKTAESAPTAPPVLAADDEAPATRVGAAASTKPVSVAAPPVADDTYEVDAGVVVRERGGDRRLRPGDPVAVGDQLVLSFSGSRPLHVYVMSQDDKGQARQLFPMSDCHPMNPLPAGRHTLPGKCGGEETSWVVTKAGGREHFLVLASVRPLKQVEQRLASLSMPTWTGGGTRRDVGGRTTAAPESPASFGFREIEQLAQGEASPKSRARGVWFQEIVLESPVAP